MEEKTEVKLPEGWIRNFSKSQNRYYFFNTTTGKSQWHVPEKAAQSEAPESLKRRGSSTTEETQRSEKRLRVNSDAATPKASSSNSNATTPTLVEEPKVAIIVPFRDLHKEQHRSAHLNRFFPYMSDFLARHNVKKYHIYVIEQENDGKKFNRGKLLNCGFDMARRDYNVFIFHDVDLLPADNLGEYYAQVPKSPLHIARVWNRYNNNTKYFGGIVSFNKADFEKINGYPNTFWGWGGEDDELYKRVRKCQLPIISPKAGDISDLEEMDLKQKLSLLKKTDWKCMVKWELLDEHEREWMTNGLSSLNYTIDSEVLLNDHCTKATVTLGLNNHWSGTY